MSFQNSVSQRSFYLNRKWKVPTKREVMFAKLSWVLLDGADCSINQDFKTPLVMK